MSPEECVKVYPRLLELSSNWSVFDGYKDRAQKLAEGMKEAADAGETLVFF